MFSEDYNVRMWFRDSDPNIKILDSFERQFGNDESVVIVVHNKDGLFNQKSIGLLKNLTEEMWLIPQIIRVDSLINYNLSTADGDDIEVRSFIEKREYSDQELASKRTQALAHKVLPGYLISKDGNSAMLFARIVPTIGSSPQYFDIVEGAKKLIEKYSDGEHEFHLTGEAAVNDAFREISNRDAAFILPLLFLLVVVYLLFVFRSVVATLLPLAIMLLSVIVTLGICFYLGYKYNEILTILPAILLAISIADGVHLISSYFQFKASGLENDDALLEATKKNLIPTLLTTLSTMLGFFSLMLTELLPIRQLGLLGGIGTAMAWIFTIFWTVPVMKWLPMKVPAIFKQKVDGTGKPAAWAWKLTSFLDRHKGKVILSFLFITLFSIWLASKNTVNSNPYLYFTEEVPLRRANDFVKEHFGGNAGPEIIIYAEKEEGIKDPEWLAKVAEYQDWINAKPIVNKSLTLVDILKEMHQVLHGGGEDQYLLATDQEAIAQELFLYTLGLPQGMDLNNQVTIKNDALRLTILWGLFDTRSWLEGVAELEAKAEEIGLRIDVTGKFLLFQRMMDYVVVTFFSSIGLAFFLVALLLSFFFRSLKIGLLSLVPNVIPLFLGAAFMYTRDISLNIGSSLVASVCLGIAVDDTIHFLSNYYAHRKKGLSEQEAIATIFTYTGQALMITTIILVSAFGLETLGDFIPNVNFGELCAVVLTFALIVDLIFLPALLLWFGRKKER